MVMSSKSFSLWYGLRLPMPSLVAVVDGRLVMAVLLIYRKMLG